MEELHFDWSAGEAQVCIMGRYSSKDVVRMVKYVVIWGDEAGFKYSTPDPSSQASPCSILSSGDRLDNSPRLVE